VALIAVVVAVVLKKRKKAQFLEGRNYFWGMAIVFQ